MNRLIAFGCSFTYGEALPDNVSLRYNIKPSQYAWPNILANKMGLECVNMGECGASNKKICHNIHHFDFQQNDFIVIMWTTDNRSCVFHNQKKFMRILPGDMTLSPDHLLKGHTNRKTKLFYQFFETDYDSHYDKYCRVNLAKYFLDTKKLPNKHFKWFPDHDPLWSNVEMPYIDFINDKALDNLHPGVKAHNAMATEILQYV